LNRTNQIFHFHRDVLNSNLEQFQLQIFETGIHFVLFLSKFGTESNQFQTSIDSQQNMSFDVLLFSLDTCAVGAGDCLVDVGYMDLFVWSFRGQLI
jgi:hypothetical protein